MIPVDQQSTESQPLVDHLIELRNRLIYSAYAIALIFIGCYYYSEKLFDYIRKPIEPYLPQNLGGLVFTGPMDKFVAHVKVSLTAAVVLSCPFWIYQAWRFIQPALKSKEKKAGLSFIFSGTFLFLMGVAFAYFLVFPLAFKFLMNFGGTTDKPFITIEQYLSFFMTVTLVFGVIFEMPLILVILAFLGVIDSAFLSNNRRYAIVIMAVIAAVVAPPDALSMILLLVPMVFLYEISILIIKGTVPRSISTD